MSKEVNKPSSQKDENLKKKAQTEPNSKTDNEVMIDELKNTANNVKKEIIKAKDIVLKLFKDNTNDVKNIKEVIPKKVEEVKNKFIKGINGNEKEYSSSATNKKANKGKINNDYYKHINKVVDILEFIKEKILKVFNYLKTVDKKNITLVIVSVFCIFGLFNIFKSETIYNYEYEYDEKIVLKYQVKLVVDFKENWIFSTYDVGVSSNSKTEILKHGKDKTVVFNLSEGEHFLTFSNYEDSSIEKEIKINVSSNMEIGIKLSCYYDRVSVTKTYTDRDIELINNEIKIANSKSTYVNKNYKDVITKLEKLGFINIEEKPMYDIELGYTDEGAVDNVKIDGKDNYKCGDIFKNDVKIVVSYHMDINDDPSRVSPPKDLTGKYDKVVQAFKDAGFTNISILKGVNYSGETENTVSSISIGGDEIVFGKTYKHNEEVVIIYYGKSEKYEEPEKVEELSLYYAKKAFEKYGKRLYPYGFKCHWILDNIATEQSEDGKSWYFKVGVTIENAYGNKRDAIAQGNVSGNDSIQRISNFFVN